MSRRYIPDGFMTLYRGLKCCGTDGTYNCGRCPYYALAKNSLSTCRALINKDALRLIDAQLAALGIADPFAPDEPAKRARKILSEEARRRKAESDRRSQEARRKRLREAGLCVVCGVFPRREGKCECAACAEKRAAKRAAERAMKRMEGGNG